MYLMSYLLLLWSVAYENVVLTITRQWTFNPRTKWLKKHLAKNILENATFKKSYDLHEICVHCTILGNHIFYDHIANMVITCIKILLIDFWLLHQNFVTLAEI
jgi:hypothetical protein